MAWLKNSIIIIIFLFLFFLLYQEYDGQAEKRANVNLLKQELINQEQANQALQEEIAKAQSDVYIERLAREKFNLKKPGESVLILQEKPAIIIEKPPDIANWQKWIKWLWRD